MKRQIQTPLCSTRHKILGLVALVGLFACGVMIGVSMNGHVSQKSTMDKDTCRDLKKEIDNMILNAGKYEPEKIVAYQDLYHQNCSGYQADKKQEKKTTEKSMDTRGKKTCEVIEMIQLQKLQSESDENISAHNINISIYENLIKNGCPENVKKYQVLVQREKDILKSLTEPVEKRPCEVIEEELKSYLMTRFDYADRASLYSKLAKQGCPENSKKYKDLAVRELDIALGVSGDELSERDTEFIIETYKRLEMEQAAQEVLNKIEKLTSPAIDFILKMEKIINE